MVREDTGIPERTAIMQDIKRENRIVSDWLLYYPERKKQHEEQLSSVTFISSPSLSDDIQGTGGTSDPTARIASARMKYDSAWFDLISDVEKSLPEKQRVFLECRRQALKHHGGGRGRPAWIAYVQCRYPLVMAERTGKSAERYWLGSDYMAREWWARIIEYTARLAAKRGLI